MITINKKCIVKRYKIHIIKTIETHKKPGGKTMKNTIIHKINYLYSIAWIKLNKSNKYQYREKSKVHKFIINQMEV